uniref:Uncharacterized protein n=1 Tax=Candidatus Kentrum sp. FM TaxID=2126340 RepID=A0A450S1Z4_9GAMM|nr:MAG: hypothetical protein BECKFM1743A_GA0114220_1002816 [Candidatus Kentron sp. FM]VFJ69214.1 MAG: hypothetical protein BECKFM1743C_GA0114222_105142 [Candidatus Kentron sp. FM]VFK06856.1 MAG: hypothetical protein BECKFM1743B_GA0114221_1002615 [Candidatus Kentron sp. FM]
MSRELTEREERFFTTEIPARKTATGDRGLLGVAIDIAIRYRYRSYRAFSIASSDSERTTTTGCGSAALDYYPAISCFLCTFPGL